VETPAFVVTHVVQFAIRVEQAIQLT